MIIEGKKINELEGLINLTNDSVLPIVIITNNIPEESAKKVTIQQLSTYLGGKPTSYYYDSTSWTLSQDKQDLIIDEFSSNTIWVFKNGLKLRPDTNSSSLDNDYWVSGTTIHFNTALDDTDVINLEVF